MEGHHYNIKKESIDGFQGRMIRMINEEPNTYKTHIQVPGKYPIRQNDGLERE